MEWKTESWDGSSWTEVNNLNAAKRFTAGSAGNTSSALCMGGEESPGDVADNEFQVANTETYDGTSWTAQNTFTTGAEALAGAGIQTAGLVFGGYTTTPQAVTENQVANTETWNGSSWTEVNDLNTSRRLGAASGATNTAILCFGGLGPPSYAVNELWNGTNWTEVGDLNEGRYFEQAAGTQTAALIFGGDPGGPFTNKTESFTDKN